MNETINRLQGTLESFPGGGTLLCIIRRPERDPTCSFLGLKADGSQHAQPQYANIDPRTSVEFVSSLLQSQWVQHKYKSLLACEEERAELPTIDDTETTANQSGIWSGLEPYVYSSLPVGPLQGGSIQPDLQL
ncbi:MAG: hypothetical protein M1831_004973 [Alyxoria varia]|nr:MAG: hypothetical protein M1831_004973 [Alyxoria varia]